MAKRRNVRLERFSEAWNALPEIDRRFVSTLVVLQQTLGEEKLSYGETPRGIQRALLTLDRKTVFSIFFQCLHLLLDPSVLKRAKKARRQREAKKRLSGAKKKKRVSSAKKRASAAKKKSRTKKPAPKRRTTRKGPAK